MTSGLLERASQFRTKAADYLKKAEVLEKMDAEVVAAMAEPGSIPVVAATAAPKKASAKAPSAPSATGKKRGRPAGSKSEDSGVKALILNILRQNRGGMSATDLAKECLQQGYKTKSGNFGNVLYQALASLRREEKKVVLNKEDKLWKLAS